MSLSRPRGKAERKSFTAYESENDRNKQVLIIGASSDFLSVCSTRRELGDEMHRIIAVDEHGILGQPLIGTRTVIYVPKVKVFWWR
jgi:hypothetical protein